MKRLGALHRPGNFVRCCAKHENFLPLIRKTGFLLVSRLQERGRLEHETQVCSRIQSRRHVCGASTTRSSETQTPPELGIMPWTGSPEQLQALEELQRRMAAAGSSPNTSTLQWFLRDRSLDVAEAEEKLRKMLTWREEFRPRRISDAILAAEATSGRGYLHDSEDLEGRPVVVVRAARHIAGESDLEESQRLCACLVESAIDRLPPGKETVLGIFDLRGLGPRNIDFAFARFLVDMLFLYYPKRMGQVLLVDAPWIFQPPWRVIKPLLRKYANLVRFVSVEQVRREYFAPGKAPPDFR